MFNNFIYFIIALLIYNTYQPSPVKNFPLLVSLSLFFGMTLVLMAYTRLRFKKIEKSLLFENPVVLDRRFTTLQTRFCILAIGLFAFNIYGLNLPDFLYDLPLFRLAPTLLALVFISIFILYLAIIWGAGHPLYQRLYRSGLTRRSYIFSNISFSIPVLLPWTLLAGVVDLLNAQPFEWPKTFLETTYGQVSYLIFFLLVVSILGPVMIQIFWRCKPLEQGFYRQRITELCQKAGLKYSDILYWPIFGGRMITAGVMGLVGRFRYILITNGLLRLLLPEEIDAVIAHEIGHIKRYHLLFYLLFFVGYPLLYYALYPPIDLLIAIASMPNGLLGKWGLNSTTISVAVFNVIMVITFLIYFRYIFGYFMRNFERQADTYVFTLLSSAQPLITTFEKIATTSAQPADKPNWHHFSIKERIEFLAACERDRSQIQRHDRKIRTSIFIYLGCLVMMAVAGYQINNGDGGRWMTESIIERTILNEIQNNSNDPKLYNAIGTLYYQQNKFPAALRAFETSNQLQPDQDEVLNTLSWIYATSDDPSCRNPQRALRLAEKAARLNPSAHILDTLAESHFVNGNIEKAIEIELEALSKADDRHYHEEQLRKFRRALGLQKE